MRIQEVAKALDPVLRQAGFSRRKLTWNRPFASLIDCIDLQVSKARDTFIVNLGVYDEDVSAICWDKPHSAFVFEPNCMVRVRLPLLCGSLDRWWSLSDDSVVGEVAEGLATYGLPFLDGMHDRSALEEHLVQHTSPERGRPDPASVMYLAVLRHLRGNNEAACRTLADLADRALGLWPGKAGVIAAKLGCGATPPA